MRHTRFPALAVAILLMVAACSGSSSQGASTPPSLAPSAAASVASGNAVSIVDFSFKPGTITIPVGTTVTWTNDDTASHTVTADDSSFTSDNLANGTTFSQTFAAAGTFAYHCSIHSAMKGTVTVQ